MTIGCLNWQYHVSVHHEIMTQCPKCDAVLEPKMLNYHIKQECDDEEAGYMYLFDHESVDLPEEKDSFYDF